MSGRGRGGRTQAAKRGGRGGRGKTGSRQLRPSPSPEASEDGSEDVPDSGLAQADVNVSGAEDSDSGSDSEGPTQSGQDRAAATPGKAAKRSYAQMVADSVDDATLRGAYANQPPQRRVERQQLQTNLRKSWPKWHLLLRSGLSVLLHGLGSKRELLDDFAREQLTDGAVVALSGWVPSVTAHKVVAAAAFALLGGSGRGQSAADLISAVRKEGQQWPDRRVYVLVHSIDGPGLRAQGEQAVLASLASCPNVHLVASCDHVNSAGLWSTALALQFRWFWGMAHTYAPYTAETLDRPSVLLGCCHSARQRGAGAVLRSMVGSGREVFALVVTSQLEDPESEGLDFKRLYRMCRELLLVTSEVALRGCLTEFIDHELIALRQASDGSGEVLYVPLDEAGLKRALADLEAIKTAELGEA